MYTDITNQMRCYTNTENGLTNSSNLVTARYQIVIMV